MHISGFSETKREKWFKIKKKLESHHDKLFIFLISNFDGIFDARFF